MKNWIISAMAILSMQLSGCSNDNTVEGQKTVAFLHQKKIDSLHKRQLYTELRDYAQKSLHSLPDTDIVNQSHLYGAIGNTYRYSYHYDSAVYYFQRAYNLALQSKNIQLKANAGVGLLLACMQSSVYKKRQDTLFRVLNDMQDSAMPLNTKALLLDAMGLYSGNRDMKGMAQFFFSKSQEIYDRLITGKSLQYADSLNLGAHYFYANRVGGKLNSKEEKMQLLKNGRYWIGSDKPLLNYYYSGMALWHCYRNRNADSANMYQDSLILLANATGLNFNDEIIDTKLGFCDYFFFEERNYKQSQKYCDEMKEYFENVVDPSIIIYSNWMKADIDLKEGRYKQSLLLFRKILPQTKCFSYAEQLRIAESIATCFVNLNRLDSAVIYYKQIAPLTIEDYTEHQKNIQQEAEAKYLNKVKQNKIDEQHKSIQYARSQRLWLSLGLALTLLSIALLFIIYRNKRKTARKLDTQNIQLSSLNLQLKEANETKSKLFGIISHDLRSPISQVYQLMQLQLPGSGIVLSSAEKEMLEQQTHDATISLLDSMEDLLIWSKTQLQSFNVNKTWTDLNDVYYKCHKLLQLQIQNKKLKMVNNIAANTLLETDTNFLLTIFRNLLNNAINASPIGGTIITELEPVATDKTQYCVVITNEGESFSQQDYTNALNNTQTSHFLKGGLGLQVVDELSRKINISISFDALPGGGAQCSIKLNCKVSVAKAGEAQ